MSFHQTLKRLVEPHIQERGKTYYFDGRVALITTSSEIISAQVRGTGKYDVVLVRSGEVLNVSCTCRYFADTSDCCKHVWATVLATGGQGLLHGFVPVDFIAVHPEENRKRALENRRERDFERPTYWRSNFRSLQPLEKAPEKPLPPSLRIYYGIDRELTLYDGLTVRVFSQTDLQSGRVSKLRDFTLDVAQLHLLPDAADREILGLLPVPERISYYSYSQRARRTPAISQISAVSDFFLPRLARTGRLYFKDRGETDLSHPLLWDENEEPWRFLLKILPTPKLYRLEGYLQRGGQSMDLRTPTLLLPGFVISNGIVSRADYGEAWAWVPLLRRLPAKAIEVPLTDGDSLMDELLNSPVAAPLEVPEELKWEEVELPAKPHLQLRLAASRDRLYANLFFDYGTLRIPLEETASRAREGKRVIIRDLPRERESSAQLEPHLSRLDFSGKRTIRLERAPALIRTFLAEGWTVDGDDGAFRSHTKLAARVASGVDWFELEGEASYGEENVSLPLLLAAIKKRESFIRLDDGSLGVIPEEWISRMSPLLSVGSNQDGSIRFNSNQAMLLDAMLATREEISFDDSFASVRKRFRSVEQLEPANAPKGFQGTLRLYQQLGLSWFNFLREIGCGGCLADDMGLGKTIQVLALLESLRSSRKKRGGAASLVVMPRSLIFNWKEEASRFAPKLRLLDHSSTERQRAGVSFEKYDVVLTTYGTVRRDIEHLVETEFEYVILDEAQAIKNPASLSAKAVRLLRARHRLALSGTPIENHLGELWSLFEFLNPGMFGSSKAFSTRGLAAAAAGSETRVALAKALRPFILRRTKEQVAPELPAKLEQTLYCELGADERKQYDELRKYYRASLLSKIEESGMQKSKMHVLEALLRLRQAACHPGLINRHQISNSSAKLDNLFAELDTVLEGGHKALVFSQFTSLLSIVRQSLDARKIRYAYLDGSSKDRQEQVRDFQSDSGPEIFLISLKAGGLGLNLTAADYVFLLDPWWNPAVEAQAVDRAHRLGQNKPVFAFRLVTRDTVEEKILELQKSKRDLADSIINADNSLLRDLKLDDLEQLLS